MNSSGSIELTQARVQARHGLRIGDTGWQQLQTTRDLGTLLAAARETSLRPWVEGLTAQSSDSQIEAALRQQWRDTVDELSRWMPGEWHAAVTWCAQLPDLPALQHLARGGMLDATLHGNAENLAPSGAAPRTGASLLASGRWSALAATWAEPQRIGQAWIAEWSRRAPPCGSEAAASLSDLRATLLQHGAAFAATPAGSGDALRLDLQQRLRTLLRRATLLPALGFIHLALCVLDLERLRGELLRRVLFTHVRVA